MIRWLAIPVAVAVLAFAPPPARAAEPAPSGDANKAEAAERFDRGMTLLEQGDNAGALAELTRVQALAPHPRVLFNLGLIQAAMNRPVEATRTLDQILAAPGTLPADSVRLARRTRDEQARRVALLEVTTNVPATIEADGIEIGKTPLDSPLPIAAGTRVVAAVSPGHLPVRRELKIAGETTEKLHLELAPSELRLAHLTVRAAVPDADVFVDGERIGRTPLPGSLALAPGPRAVELRRAGYRTARRDISLGDGATGELAFDLVEDEGAAAQRGSLVLVVNEPDPDVTIDGQPRGAYRGPLSLPAGLHRVRTARAGFLPVERDVVVAEGTETTARVTLLATPETRAAHKQRIGARSAWGWAGVLGGAALAVAAGVLVAVNRAPLADANAELDRLVPMFNDGGYCSIKDAHKMECEDALAAADATFNKYQTRQNFGLAGVGVGVLAAGVGAALLLTADDPNRYDHAPRDADAPGKPALVGWVSRSGGGLALAGRF